MAQGAIKIKTSKPSNNLHPPRNRLRKNGARTIAPKNASLVKKQKITKKYSAGLTAKTEKMLEEKAGHLELLGSGARKKGRREAQRDVGQNTKC
jgi:Protein of unknown function (DUF2462)